MTSKKKNKSKHKKKKGNLDNADDSLRILLQDEALVYCKMENYEKAIHQYTAVYELLSQKKCILILNYVVGTIKSSDPNGSSQKKSNNQALELSPNDKTALVSRSKCYLLLGQPRLALKDAEVALNEDSTYLKAIYQKAEALYHLGDFEHSLVFYHRGLHVRPELEQFRLGVQKAREAIENAIGKMKDTAIVIQHVDWEDKRQVTVAKTVNGGDSAVGGSRGSTPAVTGSTTRRKEAAVSAATTKSQSKMLLRELCVDKEYLEHLTIDPNIVSAIQENDNYILSEAKDGISFLNGREEFWKQQKLIN